MFQFYFKYSLCHLEWN